MEIVNDVVDAILDNIKNAKEYLDEDSLNEFEDVLIQSEKIYLDGVGRSGLVAKSFAMRLTHLGLKTYVVGETVAPPIKEKDCIVSISGSGETGTIVSGANIAKNRGSKVLAITSYPDSTLGQMADVVITVKGRTRKEEDDENYMKRQIRGNFTSLTPLGTVFELTALVFLDAIISEMKEKISGNYY